MLAALPGGFLLLHPGILRHVDPRGAHAVRDIHGVSGARRRVLRADGGPVGHFAGEVRQRRHELGHRWLAVDESGLVASVDGQSGMGRSRSSGDRGQPEAAAAAARGALRTVGSRLNHNEVVLV